MNQQQETANYSKSVCSIIGSGSRRRENSLRQLIGTNCDNVNYRFPQALPLFPSLLSGFRNNIAHEMLRGHMATKAARTESGT